jgi:hypothetical protein
MNYDKYTNDREKYDENLEEELKLNSNFVADSNKSIDLMKKLNNYLNK